MTLHESHDEHYPGAPDDDARRMSDAGPDGDPGLDDGDNGYRGAGEIVSQPEFQVPERLQELLRAIDDRPGLSQLLEERRAHPGVRITIGHENATAALSCTSIVTCTWSNGALSGTVGVIGPTRMHYRRVVGHLHQIVRQIDRRLNA